MFCIRVGLNDIITQDIFFQRERYIDFNSLRNTKKAHYRVDIARVAGEENG